MSHSFDGENPRDNAWATPKFNEARAKAVEMIDNGSYGLTDADFWVLKNKTKSGNTQYTSLIISHNGCLKINDCMPDGKRFKAECVTENQNGYGGSLVFTYICPEQGLYEVGEFSSSNGKNAYPYAMALKRMFDRVVLKLSRLAYSGVMSEVESDEFKRDYDTADKQPDKPKHKAYTPTNPCAKCGKAILQTQKKDGTWMSVEDMIEFSQKKYGMQLCSDCMKEMKS